MECKWKVFDEVNNTQGQQRLSHQKKSKGTLLLLRQKFALVGLRFFRVCPFTDINSSEVPILILFSVSR